MSDDREIRLTTRHDVAAASDELAPLRQVARLIEHDDFVIALVPGRIVVFRFDGLEVVERWETPANSPG